MDPNKFHEPERWFLVKTYRSMEFEILPVDIVRSSPSSVWRKPLRCREDAFYASRCARLGKYESYFPTWKEAATHAEEHLVQSLAQIKSQIAELKKAKKAGKKLLKEWREVNPEEAQNVQS